MTDHIYTIDETHHNDRLDRALTVLNDDLSRARIQTLIKNGDVYVNGKPIKKMSYPVQEGEDITFTIPEPVSAEPEPQNIPLDIVHEDEDLLVVNKQVGLVVHPGAGNYDGTLVNALLYHCAGSLSGIGGVMRPGIVHRLDKDTSGLMIVAKNNHAHQYLSEQLQDRSLTRIYHALILGCPMPPAGKIDLPLHRDPRNRLKIAVAPKGGKNAVTHYKTLATYHNGFSLVSCRLETGRTHQIRVHMHAKKYPILGDPLYGPQKNAVMAKAKTAQRFESIQDVYETLHTQMLHAHTLSFIHPRTEEEMSFSADVPDAFKNMIDVLSL